MDKTKEFILMSEKAEEIQKLWKPKPHDLFNQRGVTYVDCSEVYPFLHYVVNDPKCWTDAGALRKSIIKKQFYHGKLTWLPRQDQLQEMVLKNGTECPFECLKEFYNFCYDRDDFYGDKKFEKISQFSSMEQLWLAFVMKEKYQKIWDGNEWVKNG